MKTYLLIVQQYRVAIVTIEFRHFSSTSVEAAAFSVIPISPAILLHLLLLPLSSSLRKLKSLAFILLSFPY